MPAQEFPSAKFQKSLFFKSWMRSMDSAQLNANNVILSFYIDTTHVSVLSRHLESFLNIKYSQDEVNLGFQDFKDFLFIGLFVKKKIVCIYSSSDAFKNIYTYIYAYLMIIKTIYLSCYDRW
jgi:hypothetical protein